MSATGDQWTCCGLAATSGLNPQRISARSRFEPIVLHFSVSGGRKVVGSVDCEKVWYLGGRMRRREFLGSQFRHHC
jgi:hypothetical protein